MAGMFCSVEEAAQRLGKSEEELKEMIKQGTLQEFRDGPNLLLKVDELEEMARREGIELSTEPFHDEVQPPPPLATIPTTLETESEEIEMAEPEIPELDPFEPSASDETDLDASELESLEDALPDLDLPELDALGAEDEIPTLPDDEPLLSADEPPAHKPKAKRKRQAKPKKQPRPRPVKVRTTSPPSLTLGEWFIGGLRDDSLVAIIVLILLLGLVVAACVAVVFGANYAIENML